MTGHTGERGQVLPLVAICVVVLMGFAGMAVDVGYLQYQQRQQQSAADAAAIAGARQLIYEGCPHTTNGFATAARADAATNGYTHGSGSVLVTVANPPVSAPFSSDNCAVQTQVYSQHPTFFSKLFAPAWHGDTTTQAVATITSNNNACIYLLDSSAQFQLNGTNIDAPTCGILSDNRRVQVNGGTINVGNFGYAGTDQLNGATFTNASPTPMLPVADPCAQVPGCAALTASPPPISGCHSVQINTPPAAPLAPGCYSGIQINGPSVSLSPGVFVLTGLLQINGGSLSGSGVTIYAANNGGIQANGNSLMLSPPTSGAYANVLYYQVPGNTTQVQLNGGGQNLSGLIYAPSAAGQYNGTNGQYVVLVFGSLQLNGGFNESPGPPIGGTIVKSVVLAQ